MRGLEIIVKHKLIFLSTTVSLLLLEIGIIVSEMNLTEKFVAAGLLLFIYGILTDSYANVEVVKK